MKDSQVWRVHQNDYKSFWGGNSHTSQSLTVTNTKPMPARFQIHGKVGPGVLELEEDGAIRFRFEQHPNDLLEIVHRYAEPGTIVCDTTAGCLVTAYACLRLGHPCIVGEAQVDGDMLDNSWERLCQAYEFLRDDGLLPKAGVAVEPPQYWELEGETWMHRVQFYQKQAGLRKQRAKQTAEAKAERDALQAALVTILL